MIIKTGIVVLPELLYVEEFCMNFAKKITFFLLLLPFLSNKTVYSSPTNVAAITGATLGFLCNLYDGYFINNSIGACAGVIAIKIMNSAGLHETQASFIAGYSTAALFAKALRHYAKASGKWFGGVLTRAGRQLNPPDEQRFTLKVETKRQ